MWYRAQIRRATVVTLQWMLAAGLCVVVNAHAFASSDGQPASGQGLDLHAIVARMTDAQQQNRDRAQAYTVVRQYLLKSGNNGDSDSRVVAEVSFVPPGKKEYEIREATGSGRGEKVVRKVLDHETEMSSEWTHSAVTDANYDFALLGRQQSAECNCYVLAITPKRDSKDLMKGKVWVDPGTFQIRRMEGELAKSPSWWVKHVNVTLLFNDMSGMWLQTAAYADAEVRFFGHHVLESRDLDCRTTETDARNSARRDAAAITRTGARKDSQARGRTSAVPILGTSVVLGPR